MQRIDDSSKYQITWENELRARVEKIAARQGWTIAKTIRALLGTGCDQYEIFESFGIVKFLEVATRTKEAIGKEIGPQPLTRMARRT